MSNLLPEIVRSVEDEIKNKLPILKSEKDRIEMRRTLSALEKMIRHIRLELMKESKNLKAERKKKKQDKKNELNNIVLEKDNNNNIDTDNAKSLQKEKEDSEEE